jgi:hypothetical protein
MGAFEKAKEKLEEAAATDEGDRGIATGAGHGPDPTDVASARARAVEAQALGHGLDVEASDRAS